MLVKLAAAVLVETPFYVTLDADVLLTRPTRFEDLVAGGKGLFQPDPGNQHGNWWAASKQVRAGGRVCVTVE